MSALGLCPAKPKPNSLDEGDSSYVFMARVTETFFIATAYAIFGMKVFSEFVKQRRFVRSGFANSMLTPLELLMAAHSSRNELFVGSSTPGISLRLDG